jgi:hypothetical protein
MKQITLLLFAIYFLACSKEDRYKNICNADNPFEMEWISELHNCACTVSIFQAEYEGDPVFWQLMNDPLCQGIIENIEVRCCTGCGLTVLDDFDALVEFQKK